MHIQYSALTNHIEHENITLYIYLQLSTICWWGQHIILHKLHSNGTNNKPYTYRRSSVIEPLIPIFIDQWAEFYLKTWISVFLFIRLLNWKINTNYDYVGIWPTVTPMVVQITFVYCLICAAIDFCFDFKLLIAWQRCSLYTIFWSKPTEMFSFRKLIFTNFTVL